MRTEAAISPRVPRVQPAGMLGWSSQAGKDGELLPTKVLAGKETEQLTFWPFLFLTNPSLLWLFSRGARDCQGFQVHGESQGPW